MRKLNRNTLHLTGTPIREVAMTERLKTCLREHGVRYLEEIYDFKDEDYFQMKNMARVCIEEAKEIIELYRSAS